MPETETPSSAKENSFSAKEFNMAIQSTFKNIEGTIAIRHLWAKNSMHRFRVNWWSNEEISTSKFVVVTTNDKKMKVEEVK